MMTTRLLYRKFRWEWRFALIMGILFLVFLSLGNWQLRREAEKRTMIQQVERAAKMPPVEFADGSHLEPYQPIRVTGTYLNHHQFLLDNQISNHRAGYYVLTPMKVGKHVLLVNRGWVPRNQNREDLPVLEPVEGEQTVVGLATQTTSNALRLSGVEENPDQWPRVIETLDFQKISQAMHQPVLPWTLRLDPSEPNGFVRDWSMSWMSPERHRGYAIQWFLFAGIAVAIFFGVSMSSRAQ